MDVRILTVRQPWATALVAAGKDVENRRWTTAYRRWILIHAGKAIDHQAPDIPGLDDPGALPLGSVVGAIRLDDVRRDHHGPWAEPGCWHWCHDTSVAIRLDDPIPWRGTLGLTRAPSDLLRLLPAGVANRIGLDDDPGALPWTARLSSSVRASPVTDRNDYVRIDHH